jgi:hypothetical protein
VRRGSRVERRRDRLLYDALTESESAVQVMGDEKLRVIAHELLTNLQKNASIDWAHRTSARAKMRVLVNRILRKYGYPPDLPGRRGADGAPAGGGAVGVVGGGRRSARPDERSPPARVAPATLTGPPETDAQDALRVPSPPPA